MTDVEVFETQLELDRPFRIARGTTHTLDALLVRVSDDETIGWGEAHPSPDVTGETREDAIEALLEVDGDGIDPLQPNASIEDLDGLGPGARAGLDLALHDLVGRRTGHPAHELVDLPSGQLPCAATITVTDPDDAAEQADNWLESGYFHLKVKIDDPDEGLEAARRVAGLLPEGLPERFPEPELWIDANEALTYEQAESLLPKLADLDVVLVEQPLPREAEGQLARLAEDAQVPILLDESILSPDDVRRVGRLPGPTMVNVKVQKVGGLQAAVECLDAARATGTPAVVGCNIETGLGIAAGSALVGAVDRADLDGNRFLARDPFPLARPRPGFAGTPESPGLGAYPDPEIVPGQLEAAVLDGSKE